MPRETRNLWRASNFEKHAWRFTNSHARFQAAPPKQNLLGIRPHEGRYKLAKRFRFHRNSKHKPDHYTTGAATFTRAAAWHNVSQLRSGIGMPLFRRSASVRHSGSPATITSS